MSHARLGDSVYICTPTGQLRRVAAATGQVAAIPLEGASGAPCWLAASDGRLAIGDGRALWTLTENAERPSPGPPLQPRIGRVSDAVASGDLLVVRTATNRLTAFSLATGQTLWTRAWARVLSAPAIMSIAVLINVFDAHGYAIHALNPDSGADLWTVPDGSFAPPVFQDGRLYASGRKAVLVIDPTTGTVATRVASPDEVISSPVPLRDLLLFGTIDGVLHAAPLFQN
jgi:outer membrane protein assembly factor BamB